MHIFYRGCMMLSSPVRACDINFPGCINMSSSVLAELLSILCVIFVVSPGTPAVHIPVLTLPPSLNSVLRALVPLSAPR